MPAQQGLRLEDDRCVEQAREEAIEADEDQAIYGFQLGSGWRCPRQDDELLSQVKDLSVTPCVCAMQPRDQHPEKSQNNEHPGGSLSDWNAVDRLDKIFSRDTRYTKHVLTLLLSNSVDRNRDFERG